MGSLTEAYLERLPSGLASYPGAQARVEIYAPYRERLRAVAGGQPGPVRGFLEGRFPLPGSVFIAETVGQYVELLAIERARRDGTVDGYLDWVFRQNLSLYRESTFAPLMRLLSPTLVFMGASRRWGTFHRGTDLRASRSRRDGARTHAQITLDFPAHLYPPEVGPTLATVFLAVLTASSAEDPRCEVSEVAPTRMTFIGSW